MAGVAKGPANLFTSDSSLSGYKGTGFACRVGVYQSATEDISPAATGGDSVSRPKSMTMQDGTLVMVRQSTNGGRGGLQGGTARCQSSSANRIEIRVSPRQLASKQEHCGGLGWSAQQQTIATDCESRDTQTRVAPPPITVSADTAFHPGGYTLRRRRPCRCLGRCIGPAGWSCRSLAPWPAERIC
jgi:hypothetical protein